MSNRIPPELFKNILKEKNNYKRLIDKMDDVISALYSLSFGYTEEDLKEYIEINQMFFSSLTHMLKDIENNHIKALQCLIPESEWEKYKL